MQVDEQPGHRVEEPVPIAARLQRDAHQEAPVLERVAQELRDQDAGPLVGALREPDRPDGRQADVLQVQEGVVLAAGDLERLLLERVERPVDHDETHEVARRTDRQLAEDDAVGTPVTERQLPRKVEQALRWLPEPKTGEGGVAQRRFRR